MGRDSQEVYARHMARRLGFEPDEWPEYMVLLRQIIASDTHVSYEELRNIFRLDSPND